jgi:hypothetical protein
MKWLTTRLLFALTKLTNPHLATKNNLKKVRLTLDFLSLISIVILMITKLKTEIVNKAWSFQPKNIEAVSMQSALFNIEHLADLINSEVGYGKQSLTKDQTKACELVARNILESLNKSLTLKQD